MIYRVARVEAAASRFQRQVDKLDAPGSVGSGLGEAVVDPTKVGDVLADVDSLDDEIIMFVPEGEDVSLSTSALLLSFEEYERGADGYRYFLEGENIKESIEVWSLWRDGRLPTLDDKLAAVVYYATNDAFMPTE
jgi:hypothetical protein